MFKFIHRQKKNLSCLIYDLSRVQSIDGRILFMISKSTHIACSLGVTPQYQLI